jgi:hypothetical protein
MINVAIMGHGVVGSGTAEILINHADRIAEKVKEPLNVKYILDLRDFEGLTYSDKFTKDFNEILNDEEIRVVVETMGGLHPSYEFVKACLESGKSVVTSNKELVAAYGADLLELARQENVNFYSEEGCLDFELFAQSEQFLSGVEKIKNSVEKGYNIVLLCAEKEPIQCHRTILVARAFSDLGYKIIHLMPDNQTKTQKQIEQELLNKYFPNRGKMTLFSTSVMSDEECLVEAYKIQNKKIGYRLEGEEE